MTRHRSTLWTFAITSVALFMVSLDNLVVTTALPVIRSDLGASLEQLEWTVNAYTLAPAAIVSTRVHSTSYPSAQNPLTPIAHSTAPAGSRAGLLVGIPAEGSPKGDGAVTWSARPGSTKATSPISTFATTATDNAAVTEYSRNSTNPASRAPTTAPRVLMPYRNGRWPRSASGCLATKRERTGRVPPMSIVGRMRATAEKSSRTIVR